MSLAVADSERTSHLGRIVAALASPSAPSGSEQPSSERRKRGKCCSPVAVRTRRGEIRNLEEDGSGVGEVGRRHANVPPCLIQVRK